MARHVMLDPDAHRDLRVSFARGAQWGDAVMSAIVTPAEFRRVQNDYAILFRHDLAADRFDAHALFGFEPGENLYLEGDRWDAGALPLAIDIQPFLIGATRDGTARQVHIDLDHVRVAPAGVRLFDEDGRTTPFTDAAVEKLSALDTGWQAAPAFFSALRRHELLEPFTLEVTLADGAVNRLVGYHVIDEAKLRALDAAALGELHGGGHLMPIFMALASLTNLSGLVARKNRRSADG
ncbi:SapC family protein [Sphingomonas baiyangensis]|uniref:Multidrug transporter n=1 Tax=Sphingomonas baiyangensis TaxID=2572576 RepID=A0A4U1L8H4_9SPHN|nr:SapC family protein [Sphingomonas baiyangensis]TKD52793.1 multidrug transporter [Sphingomonas baiyangensis]